MRKMPDGGGIDAIDGTSAAPAWRTVPPRIAPQAATSACVTLIGFEPAAIEYPGGLSRCSVRAVAGEQSCIVTQRKHAARADLEAGVLRELRAGGAPVPAVLAFDGEWLIQQDLGPRRLSAALTDAQGRPARDLIAQAAQGLLLCQRAAERCGLAQRVAPIGMAHDWLDRLIGTPRLVAQRLGLPDPAVGEVIRPAQLVPRHLAFVKWDARPGNAVATDDGSVVWIDWEHCGARDALDDLAWLLCDEYMPDDPALEAALLSRFVPLFALQSKRSLEDAQVYLARFGALHTCMRLLLVLRHKGDGDWWDRRACERTDRIGVTAEAALALCARGARWSGRFPGGTRMSQFFSDAGKRLCTLTADSANTARAESPALA